MKNPTGRQCWARDMLLLAIFAVAIGLILSSTSSHAQRLHPDQVLGGNATATPAPLADTLVIESSCV